MYKHFFKRILDFFCALAAIVCLCPLLVVLTLVGAVKMKGNPFFTQPRPGKDEKIFKLVKFRTMTNERDANGKLLPDDVRLTRYGKFLRSTSLDEPPERFDILKGDMAVIGPRPQLVRDMVFMTPEQRRRHTVRQGLSGLAQINGRNAVTWETKIAYDLENHLHDTRESLQALGHHGRELRHRDRPCRLPARARTHQPDRVRPGPGTRQETHRPGQVMSSWTRQSRCSFQGDEAQPPTGFKAFHPRCHCTSCMRLRLGNNMYHKEWDRAMTRTILFDEFAEDIKKEREAAAAEANARADKEKSRADEANARADKYAAILKEHGLL